MKGRGGVHAGAHAAASMGMSIGTSCVTCMEGGQGSGFLKGRGHLMGDLHGGGRVQGVWQVSGLIAGLEDKRQHGSMALEVGGGLRG